MNYQALFLSYELISIALHTFSFHPAAVYISDLVEHILLLPERKIPPEIIFYFGWISSHDRPRDTYAQKNKIDLDSTCLV